MWYDISNSFWDGEHISGHKMKIPGLKVSKFDNNKISYF